MDTNELDQLKADLRRMQARLEQLEAPVEEPVNRRNMLRGIGAAAAGAAVGGLAFARPAAAAPVDMFTESTYTAQAPTEIVLGSSWDPDATGGDFIGGFTVTTDPNFTNLNAALSCIVGYADSSLGGGHNIGLFGASKAGIGAKLDGPIPLKLTDESSSGAPSQASGTRGQFKVDDGDLWFCVTSSGSLRWRKITGTGVAGGFHAVTPGRVYDSRPGNGGVGPLGTGANRTISVANRINPVGGATVETNFIPAGAIAVTLNVTAVTTVGNGFLAVNPGGNTTVGASALNWTAGQTIANGIVCALNTSRQLTVIAGGTATSTNFIIDITGYYL